MDNIEDADIVVDLSGGKLAANKYRERIEQLEVENEKAYRQRCNDLLGLNESWSKKLAEAIKLIKQLEAEKEELKVYEKFYTHIRTELTERYPERHFCPVVCKLCGKTFQKITGKSEIFEQALKDK